MVEHGCNGFVLHKKKRLKKVTVLNALNRTCLDSIQADLISTAEQF